MSQRIKIENIEDLHVHAVRVASDAAERLHKRIVYDARHHVASDSLECSVGRRGGLAAMKLVSFRHQGPHVRGLCRVTDCMLDCYCGNSAEKPRGHTKALVDGLNGAVVGNQR